MLQPHQQRVVDEEIELNEKTSKLDLFLFGKVFNSLDKEEQLRLMKQLAYMRLYRDMLRERISNF